MSSLYDPLVPLLDIAACEKARLGTVSADTLGRLAEAGFVLSNLDKAIAPLVQMETDRLAS